jgi:hypothetical protein
LTNLHLERFFFEDTDLCVPADTGFLNWLVGIKYLRPADLVLRLPLIVTP